MKTTFPRKKSLKLSSCLASSFHSALLFLKTFTIPHYKKLHTFTYTLLHRLIYLLRWLSCCCGCCSIRFTDNFLYGTFKFAWHFPSHFISALPPKFYTFCVFCFRPKILVYYVCAFFSNFCYLSLVGLTSTEKRILQCVHVVCSVFSSANPTRLYCQSMEKFPI